MSKTVISPSRNCPHVISTDPGVVSNILDGSETVKNQSNRCVDCGKQTVNLWRCLQLECAFVGCGEKYKDHSQSHAQQNSHPLMINLGTKRVWCILCKFEVHLQQLQNSSRDVAKGVMPRTQKGKQSPISVATETSLQSNVKIKSPLSTLTRDSQHLFSQNVYGVGVDEESAGSADDNSSESSGSCKSFPVSNPVGLTGLKNLGNTCYLNSAVQALSACTPLTNFFLTAYAPTGDEKPPIAKYYHQVLSDIWSEKKPSFVIPSTFVQGFKTVNPAFRGYNQQDSQEFLRCFMDRLHEELKKPITYPVCLSCNATMHAQFSDGGGGGSASGHQFCEHCFHSLTSMQRDDLVYESSINNEEHCDPVRSPLSSGGQLASSTADSGYSDQSFLSASASNLPLRRSPDLYQQQLSSPNSTGTADGRRGLDRRRTISASSALSSSMSIGTRQNKSAPSAVRYSSIISEVFNGKILSSVQCLHCHQTSEISETFQDLSLPIPNKEDLYLIHHQPQLVQPTAMGSAASLLNSAYNTQGWVTWIYDWIKSMFWGPVITLNDCLAAFFSADELKGENMYSCEKCQKLRNGLKVSKVQELPEVLCVHLKRFRHEYLLSSKVSTYVSFPMEGLSLAPFLSDQNQPAMYDLVATICHYGYASGGHYTAYALNELNKCWYEYDDQIVTQVSASQIQKAEVYVLFYKKRASPEMESHRKQVKIRSRSARHEGRVHNVNETKHSAVGSARSMENIAHENLISSPSDSPTSVAASTRSQTRSRQRNSKSVSVGSDTSQFGDRLMQYYISKHWLNRFTTFADPGPITNSDFLCQHSRIPPQYVSVLDSMAEEVPGVVWEYLSTRFRGGPVVNQLHVCAICQQEKVALEQKRTAEREAFQKMNNEFRSQKCPAEAYLIDMRWYKQWEAFVRAKADPPGPIDNHAIQHRGGRYSVSDYDVGQISFETWRYLVAIYGGGPELVHRNERSVSPSDVQPSTS